MSVAIETSRVEYTGNGATDEFPTTFKFFDSGDLVVEVLPDGGAEEDWELQVEGVDYEVTGAGSASGGTVTFTTAPEDDATVRITRVVEFTQLLALSAQGTFSPRSIENQFDKLTMIAQQLNRTDDELLDAIADAREDLLEGLAGITAGDVGAAFGFLTEQAPLTGGNALQVRFRTDGARVQVNEHNARWRSFVDGADVYDIRDLGSGNVMNGDSEADTEALIDAVAVITSSSTSTNNKPGVVKFPRGQLLLEEELTLYGGAGTASSWLGANGRSRGPDGTEIKWVGGLHSGPMIHLLGMNGGLFENLCFNGNSLARFCVWAETNQRNGGAGSSGMKWRDCTFSAFGERGVGMICGDEVRMALTVSGVTGAFTPGEFVLDNYNDCIATVVSYSAGTLNIKEVIGSGFGTIGGTLSGLTSGATATVDAQAIDPNYQGNMQFSEGVWDHCFFQGSGSVNGWAGWGTFGANNNKNYTLIHPGFDQVRYGIDGGWGSGYLTVTDATGGNIGQAGKGAICRANNFDLVWRNGNFETFTGYVFNLNNVKADIEAGEYYGSPANDKAIYIEFGEVNLRSISLGTPANPAKIVYGGGTLNLDGVNWREDFTGYLPIEDVSGNPLGGQGSADAARTGDNGITARGCIGNVNGGKANQRQLPNLLGKPLSPLRNQLLDDGVSGITVVQRGILSCAVEARTIPFAKVAAGAAVTFAKTKAKSLITFIVIDVTTVFTGGALSAMTMKIGDGTTADLYLPAQDVFTAVGRFTNFTPALAPWAGGNLIATFTATGDTVAALTQGSVTVYVGYVPLL